MIFGVIVAGGVGTRMGANMPKQFLDLNGRPIIMHTLQAFLNCEMLEQIYMGVHPEWMGYMADLVCQHIGEKEQSRVHLVPGGAERNDTIMNVIAQIEADYGTEEAHYIITQDGVRPFVSQRLIQEHVEKVVKYNAVNTAIPAVDTIMVSKDGQVVDDIPERKYLYQVQTPQSFRMDLLKNLYSELTEDEKKILTDACKICTVRGVPVRIVMGDVTNMKITTTADFEIAKIIAKQL